MSFCNLPMEIGRWEVGRRRKAAAILRRRGRFRDSEGHEPAIEDGLSVETSGCVVQKEGKSLFRVKESDREGGMGGNFTGSSSRWRDSLEVSGLLAEEDFFRSGA